MSLASLSVAYCQISFKSPSCFSCMSPRGRGGTCGCVMIGWCDQFSVCCTWCCSLMLVRLLNVCAVGGSTWCLIVARGVSLLHADVVSVLTLDLQAKGCDSQCKPKSFAASCFRRANHARQRFVRCDPTASTELHVAEHADAKAVSIVQSCTTTREGGHVVMKEVISVTYTSK